MAENERLDVLKSPRWLRVMRFIASSPRDAAIAGRLVDAMYRTLRNAAKQIPLEELLKAAATRQPGFSDAIAQCRHDFAEMIERVAADSHKDDASIAERYVDAILDRYFDQMALTLVGQEAFPTFDSFCEQANVWKASIGPALKRLASNLESGQMPRVPAQPAAVRAAEREELMALSLLTGSTQRNRHGARSQIPGEPR
jgi:predicted HAD superfamily Cof-like phosphohydrolase